MQRLQSMCPFEHGLLHSSWWIYPAIEGTRQIVELQLMYANSATQQSTTDVTQKRPSPFPSPYYIGYLNLQAVQQALGVPRNFTENNFQVSVMFAAYDELMGGHLENIGYLLDRGVNVAMAYGDRDYSNNCKSPLKNSVSGTDLTCRARW